MSAGDWKALFKAPQEGDLELVQYYIRLGVDINYQHPEVMTTALIESIRSGHFWIANCLLKNGADPKLKEVFGGETPLSLAELKGNEEVIALLKSYL